MRALKLFLMVVFYSILHSLIIPISYAQVWTPWGEVFFEPQKTYPEYAYVYCTDEIGGLVHFCNVNVTTGYHQFTNGHIHDNANHPYSTVSPSSLNTGVSGYAYVTLSTTAIGQAEFFDVCPTSPALACGRLNWVVGYSDLIDYPRQPIPYSSAQPRHTQTTIGLSRKTKST